MAALNVSRGGRAQFSALCQQKPKLSVSCGRYEFTETQSITGIAAAAEADGKSSTGQCYPLPLHEQVPVFCRLPESRPVCLARLQRKQHYSSKIIYYRLSIEFNYDPWREIQDCIIINVEALTPIFGRIMPPAVEKFTSVSKIENFVRMHVHLNTCSDYRVSRKTASPAAPLSTSKRPFFPLEMVLYMANFLCFQDYSRFVLSLYPQYSMNQLIKKKNCGSCLRTRPTPCSSTESQW